MEARFKRIKYACYMSNIGGAVVGNISPVLFVTFHELYGISYTLLGLLVLINFCTQLAIDLVFSFFSHRFNISKTVKCMPVLTLIGLLVYALFPFFFPRHVYIGLVIGTFIFAAAGGLGEVLISPVIAAIPSENPEHEMSKLHSIYAWGVVGVIIVSTLFLLLFGNTNWQYLVLLLTLVPLVSCLLFFMSEVPKLQTPERASGALHMLKNKQLIICFVAMFLGGAAECTMAQWSSSYLEAALGIPKIWGDLFGVALFSVMLGLGRTLYSKYGVNIERVLLFGAVGATVCYFLAAVVQIEAVGLIACAFTGLCTSMMWPGELIVASKRVPNGGVFVFAMMAAGGDMGASVVPQLLGIVTDTVAANERAAQIAHGMGLTAEQLGMKLGMFVGMLFPLIAIFVYLYFYRTRKSFQNDK